MTDAFEVAYTGTLGQHHPRGRRLPVRHRPEHQLHVPLPPGNAGVSAAHALQPAEPGEGSHPPTPTTPAEPITLSPVLMGVLAAVPPQFGGPILLPEKVATYLNLGPIRNRGIELSIDHRFNNEVSVFANYSWQDTPKILDADSDQIPYPINEVGIPSANRFNAGVGYNGSPFFGNADRQLRQRGAVGRRAQRHLPRLHRRLHDAQRHRRGEAGRGQGDAEPEGNQPDERDDPAAHLRRHPQAERRSGEVRFFGSEAPRVRDDRVSQAALRSRWR